MFTKSPSVIQGSSSVQFSVQYGMEIQYKYITHTYPFGLLAKSKGTFLVSLFTINSWNVPWWHILIWEPGWTNPEGDQTLCQTTEPLVHQRGEGVHKEAEWVTNAMLMGGLVKFRSYRQVLWNGIWLSYHIGQSKSINRLCLLWIYFTHKWPVRELCSSQVDKGKLNLKKECVVVLGQYRAVLFGTWWYWVSITWYCLVLSDTGLV